MSKFSLRKLFLFGRYSIALLLPRGWVRELELDSRSFVALEFDRTKKRIIVSPAPESKINNGNLRPTKKLSSKTTILSGISALEGGILPTIRAGTARKGGILPTILIKEPGGRKNEQKNRPDDQEWEPIPQL